MCVHVLTSHPDRSSALESLHTLTLSHTLFPVSLAFGSARSGLVQASVYLHISPDSKNDHLDFALTKDTHTEANQPDRTLNTEDFC